MKGNIGLCCRFSVELRKKKKNKGVVEKMRFIYLFIFLSIEKTQEGVENLKTERY
jgi:uncharacterized membrane protein